MNPEIKALWIEALRSGEYKQGRGCLKADYSGKAQYCCLGVLTELAVKAGVIEEGTTDFDGEYCYSDVTPDGYKRTEQFGLPLRVQEWSGVDNTSGRLADPIDFTKPGCSCGCEGAMLAPSLICLNDTAKYTFAQIADVIEEQF